MTYSVHYKVRSTGAVLQILLCCLFASAMALLFADFLMGFYLGARSTAVGFVVNSIILGLFSLATLYILVSMVAFRKEELAVQKLFQNISKDSKDPMFGIPSESIVGQRYHILQSAHQRQEKIDLQRLGVLLSVELHAKLTFPKFVAGILVLIGMLGTILSLAIALLGASNLIATVDSVNDLGAVLNGMSTALSTTMTGIVTYVLFRFFLSRYMAVQSNLQYTVERLTTLQLGPRFLVDESVLAPKIVSLVDSLNLAATKIAEHHQHLMVTSEKFADAAQTYSSNINGMLTGISQINDNLSKGFRLDKEELS